MLGVAFVFDRVLGNDNGLKRTAVLRVAAAALRAGGTEIDTVRASETIDGTLGAVASQGADPDAVVARAFAAVCGPQASIPVLLERYRQTAAELAPDVIRSEPEAEQTLRVLQRLAIPHAIVTDDAPEIARHKAASIGFSGPVCPRTDHRGQHPGAAFAELSTALALPLERIYFVGADPLRDIEPAGWAGLQTVWLAVGVTYPAGLAQPNFVVERLIDVLEILREPYTRSLLGLRYLLNSVSSAPPGYPQH
jgi:phosphoglycolate phosphatase-like HAD superfamily hydrolase